MRCARCLGWAVVTALAQTLLEIDAAPVLFPIPVTRGFGPVASADLLLHHLFRHFSTGVRRRGFGWLCSGIGIRNRGSLTYHGGLATHKILIPAPLADNLSRTTAPVFALPDHAVVALDGPDATAFAHAQFANDVAALAPGHWQWNAWLTPKGRVIALFLLAKPAEDRLRLVLPDYPAGDFAAALQRFVFRRKLKIAVEGEQQVEGAFAAPVQARGSRLGDDGGIELDLSGEGGPRLLRIASTPDAVADNALQQAWFRADLSHGVPRLPTAQREQWTPQQLSLERLEAFSVKKGCYPGQEIVARTHFLGKAKRGLMLFTAAGPVPAGANVRGRDADVGTVVAGIGPGSSASGLLLAVLPLEHAGDGLTADGVALQRQTMLGGLQR